MQKIVQDDGPETASTRCNALACTVALIWY